MKAVAIKDVKKLEVVDIEEPNSNNGDVVIEVLKTGICGSDLHYFELGMPSGLVMGHEFCGKVIDPGDRIDLNVGDMITALPLSPEGNCSCCHSGNIQYCPETWSNAVGLSASYPGALAEKLKIRPDMVIKVPDNVSSAEAAMVEPTAVGLHAVHLADIRVGDKVLVVGGGIIGLVSAMFAKIEGATYVALSETNEARGKNSVKLKVADEWFDAKAEDFQEKLKAKTGEGFDVVIDCSGNSKAVNSGVEAVKPGGKVILVGVSMAPIEFNSLSAVMKELTITGAIAYTYDEFKTCLDLMAYKQIDVKKFISKTISLEEVNDAYLELISGTSDAIKIQVDPSL